MNEEEKQKEVGEMNSSDSSDVSFVSEEEEANPQALIKRLREELKTAKKERQEYLEGWQRTKADFVNARKQEEISRQSYVKFAEEKLISSLLGTLRNFDLATGGKGWETIPENWRKGLEQVKYQLTDILKSSGLTTIDPQNQAFNPEEHESTSVVPVENEADNHKVMSVLQKGYKLHGKVLEPAKVVIGEYKK